MYEPGNTVLLTPFDLAALTRDAALDMAAVQGGAAGALIVRLVGVELVRAPAGPAAGPRDRGETLEPSKAVQHWASIGAVGPAQADRERPARARDYKLVLRRAYSACRCHVCRHADPEPGKYHEGSLFRPPHPQPGAAPTPAACGLPL